MTDNGRETSNPPRVCIVILNWNNAPDTLGCLRSVNELTYENFSTIVVDNGSHDDSVAQIRCAFPKYELLQTNENLGYAEGNNVGIRHALADGADYVLILNNDTAVGPTMLTELVQFADSNKAVGMVGPTMYCFDRSETLFAAGSFIDWKQGECWHRGMFRAAAEFKILSKPERVDFISGCCVLVRRSLIEEIGGLDAGYYLNYEDVEWAVRAQRQGYEIWYVPSAIMWHKVSATFGMASPANTYYTTRNALRFFWQNAPASLRVPGVLSILYRTWRTIAAWSVKSKYHNDLFRRRRAANFLALRDFWAGRFGVMGADVAAVCYPSVHNQEMR